MSVVQVIEGPAKSNTFLVLKQMKINVLVFLQRFLKEIWPLRQEQLLSQLQSLLKKAVNLNDLDLWKLFLFSVMKCSIQLFISLIEDHKLH